MHLPKCTKSTSINKANQNGGWVHWFYINVEYKMNIYENI
jgi:hypothetical protein